MRASLRAYVKNMPRARASARVAMSATLPAMRCTASRPSNPFSCRPQSHAQCSVATEAKQALKLVMFAVHGCTLSTSLLHSAKSLQVVAVSKCCPGPTKLSTSSRMLLFARGLLYSIEARLLLCSSAVARTLICCLFSMNGYVLNFCELALFCIFFSSLRAWIAISL